MTPADLEILLQEGEGTTLVLKEGFAASLAREIVAMANTIGGRILLGVRDDGVAVGLRDSNALRARIQDVARNCDPPVRLGADRARAQSGAQSTQVLAALKRTLGQLLATGLAEYALPDKPASRLQRYRLTDAGRAYLKKRPEQS